MFGKKHHQSKITRNFNIIVNKNIFFGAGLALALSACGGGGTTNTGPGGGVGGSVTPGDSGDSSSILGSWSATSAGGSSFWSFSEDGNYIYINEQSDPFDDSEGLEWGTYTRSSTGDVSARVVYDGNGGAGFSDFPSSGTLSFNLQGNELLLAYYDGQESGQELNQRVSANGIVGTWFDVDNSAQLNMLSFHADGTYLHARVDNDDASRSGAEKGTYTYDDTTGEIVVSIVFDQNGSAGLAQFVSPAKVFLQADDTTLTGTIDLDGDGMVDEQFNFLRE